MTTYKLLFLALLFLGGGAIGWLVRGPGDAKPTVTTQPADAGPQHWTCPMHAEIDLPQAGKCPKCGMDLVERKSGSEDAGPRTLVMSESDKKLAEIVTTPVVRKFVTGNIQLVGKVDYDETRVKTISAWVPGRLDRLFVDYTGIHVRKGDHLVEMYSPDFLTAQEELIEARKQVDAAVKEASEFLPGSNKRALDAARDKLRLWGLTAAQIAATEKSGKVEDHVQINSPMTGVVIHKSLNEGDYVKTGSRIYRIADLSHLWVQLDAYESDLPHIHYGQEVSIQVESYPGRVFEGWVSFIDPVLNQSTQTIKVRVNVENRDGLLKPGMFVRTRITSTPGHAGGIDSRFKGKWICPMHPEVVEDLSGACRVCGMNLVKAEELGQLMRPKSAGKPLIIPVTAALITGRRAVVYVQVPGKDRPTFQGREVVLGPRAGKYYHVVSGLSEGEEVVVNGNFKIDSALQILAEPSMMSMPADPSPMQGREFLLFRKSIEPVYAAYFGIQAGLAKDDSQGVLEPYRRLDAALDELSQTSESRLPTDASKAAWQEIKTDLQDASKKAQTAQDLAAAREAFATLSRRIIELQKTFGHSQLVVHKEVFCPMAFDNKGAIWLQAAGPVTNPYFGTAMLSCGEEKASYAGRGGPTGRTGTNPREPEEAVNATRPADKPGQPGTEEGKHDHMKMPAGKSDKTGTKEFRSAVAPLWKAYLQVQEALASDALEQAQTAFSDLSKSMHSEAMHALDDSALEQTTRKSWTDQRASLGAAAGRGSDATDLAIARTAFLDASAAILAIEKLIGHGGTDTYYEMFCPMAFGGKGGTWLQSTDTLRNPYYGASMIGCGSVKQQHKAKQER